MATVAFYVTAHQDDWQFWRGEQAYVDLKSSKARIVFIQTTAGDAGQVDGWWEARERGVIASIRSAIPPSPLRIDTRNFRGHQITVYECGNAADYCLRLPDGVGIQSLSNLRDGVIDSLTAVDHSTTYEGWEDFWLTLQDIMETERIAAGLAHPWVNAGDYNSVRNPGDHDDHKATADALRKFVYPTYRRAWFVTDDTRNRPANLSGSAYANKRILFDAYADAVLAETTKNGNPTPANETEWNWWGNRSYAISRNFNQIDD
jgi:hypothetical protein